MCSYFNIPRTFFRHLFVECLANRPPEHGALAKFNLHDICMLARTFFHYLTFLCLRLPRPSALDPLALDTQN